MAYEKLAQAFTSGDVIYGLDKPRKAAIQAVLKRGFKQSVSFRKLILGCIPGKTETRAVVLIQNDLTNAVWDPLKPNTYATDKSIGSTLNDSTRGQQFKGFLSKHPRYNVAKNNTVATSHNGAVEAWRRTSKGGIEFQVRQRKATVHFVVADIIDTIDQVAKKEKFGTSITSAELRWLFRHRYVQDVQNHVRFWLADREVSHDVVFGKAGWTHYKPTHTYGKDWTQK